MDTFARATVEKFLREKNCIDRGIINGRAIWIKDDAITILLPTSGRIDYDHFEAIAIDQLEVSFHDFDYWIGENC